MSGEAFPPSRPLSTEQREALRRRLVALALLPEDGTPAGAAPPDVRPVPEDLRRLARALPGGADGIEAAHPLTPLREGLLVHAMQSGGSDPYVLRSVTRFANRERLDAFVAALGELSRRHAVLRSSIAWEGLDAPLQVVWREAPPALEEVAIAAGGAELTRRLLLLADAPQHRIDVRRAPLLRLLAAADGAGGAWQLLLASHHLIGDRASLDLMQQELAGILRGEPAPAPELTFAEYARRIRGDAAGHTAFFRGMLEGFDTPTAPWGLLQPIDGADPLDEARCELPDALVQALLAQTRGLGLPVPAIVHTAWALVLARAGGGDDDLVFGTVLSGRMSAPLEMARTLGMLVNTLPLRVRLRGKGIAACVGEVQRTLAGLIAHEHAPLSLAQQCSGVRAPTPLSGALLDYQRDAPATAPPDGGADLLGGWGRTSFPLALTVEDTGGRIRCMLQAAAPVDATRVLASFLRALEATVDALARAPSSSALDLDVLPPEEARRILAWGDGTVRAAPVAEPLLHRAFERQAARALRGAWCGHGDLWCAGRAGRSAGAPPARPGRRRGCAGRAVRAGGYRDGAGHAGHPEGRRRLPAAGPAPSAGAAAAVGRGRAAGAGTGGSGLAARGLRRRRADGGCG